MEISAVSAGVELVVSILRTRTQGMALHKMPLFAWYILAMALMIVVGFPPLILGSVLLELERAVGMPFFQIAEAVIPSCGSICFGCLVTLRCTSSFYLPRALFRRQYRFLPGGYCRLWVGGSCHRYYGLYQFWALGTPHVYSGYPTAGSGIFLGG